MPLRRILQLLIVSTLLQSFALQADELEQETSPGSTPSSSKPAATPAPKSAADLPGGKVVRIREKRMIVRWKNHGFRKGDRFFVLNNVGTGILVELEVTKLGKKRRQLFEARMVDNPLGVKYSTLFNAKTIKIEDAEANPTLFPDGPIKMRMTMPIPSPTPVPIIVPEDPFDADLYLNPTLRLAVATGQVDSLGVPTVTDTSLSVPMNRVQAHFETFLPPLSEARWLNGFGLDVRYEPISKSKVSFRSSGSEVVQDALVKRQRLAASFLFRPSFKNRFLARLGLRITAYDQLSETVEVEEGNSILASPELSEELTIKGLTGALEYEIALFPNLFVGLVYVAPLVQKATLKSDDGETEPVTQEGTFKAQSIFFELGSRYSLLGGRPRDLVFDVKGHVEVRREQLAGFEDVAPNAGSKPSQVRLGATIGIGFVN